MKLYIAISVDALDVCVSGVNAFSTKTKAEDFILKCCMEDIRAFVPDDVEQPNDMWSLDRIQKLACEYVPESYQPWTIEECEIDVAPIGEHPENEVAPKTATIVWTPQTARQRVGGTFGT